ncbi:site-specific integrase, partial [Accumulibacter sp.]|uniref:tyrosine-type recombinase/integrase n=1 Tax=Accumulibacter sp. TaxID=2053492 RepID=UPI0025D1F6CE
MSELRERMSNAMSLRGMAARTQEAYIGAVADLAMFYNRSPAELRVEEVHAWLLHLIRDRKLACASVNKASCALRFLCRRVLGLPEAGFDIPMAKVPKRLPQILSREEVARLIDAAHTLRGRTLLMTTYAAGLRVSEVCALQLGDIESAADRMCLKVRHGKGGKDRYTLLSPLTRVGASDAGRGLPPARAGGPRQPRPVVGRGEGLAGDRRLSHGRARRP